MDTKPCAACGKPFRPRPQRPDQCFCAQPGCQRERRRRWQKAKLQADPDYRANQARAQRAWAQRHPEYWRGYRAQHPWYCEANRARQAQRDARRGALAKMDVSTSAAPVRSGTYRLVPVHRSDLAKMDVCTVEITVVSSP